MRVKLRRQRRSGTRMRSTMADVFQLIAELGQVETRGLKEPGVTRTAVRSQIRSRVAQWLHQHRHERLSEARQALCAVLGVSDRTLREWARKAEPESNVTASAERRGRPGHDLATKQRVYRAVRAYQNSMRRIPSWREVQAQLIETCPDEATMPRRLVQRYATAISRARRSAHATALAANRQHVTVLARNVIWAGDATHLCGTPGKDGTYAEVVSDVASSKVVGLSLGALPTSRQVGELLCRSAAHENADPLVYSSDNGSENSSHHLEALLKSRQIIHLRNLPHTPEHNAHAERQNRKLKACLQELSLQPPGDRRSRLATDLEEAVLQELNTHQRLSHRAWRTPDALHKSHAPWYPAVTREDFYAAACAAVAKATNSATSFRARRMAEREAIFQTLERFQLIRRTRGRLKPDTR